MLFNYSSIAYPERIDRLGVELNRFHLVEVKFSIKAIRLRSKVLIVYFEHLKLNVLQYVGSLGYFYFGHIQCIK